MKDQINSLKKMGQEFTHFRKESKKQNKLTKSLQVRSKLHLVDRKSKLDKYKNIENSKRSFQRSSRNDANSKS